MLAIQNQGEGLGGRNSPGHSPAKGAERRMNSRLWQRSLAVTRGQGDRGTGAGSVLATFLGTTLPWSPGAHPKSPPGAAPQTLSAPVPKEFCTFPSAGISLGWARSRARARAALPIPRGFGIWGPWGPSGVCGDRRCQRISGDL